VKIEMRDARPVVRMRMPRRSRMVWRVRRGVGMKGMGRIVVREVVSVVMMSVRRAWVCVEKCHLIARWDHSISEVWVMRKERRHVVEMVRRLHRFQTEVTVGLCVRLLVE
jgi:hypothetical protein